MKDDYRYGIKREPLTRADGTDTQYDALYRSRDGFQLSVVSRDYQLITHAKAIDFVENTLEQSGIKAEPWRMALTNDGKRMLREYKLPGYEFDIPGDDGHIPTLKVGNSIDRSRSFLLDFGTYRKICSNGATAGVKVFYVKISHYRDNIQFQPIGDELIENIAASIKNTKENAERLMQVSAKKYMQELLTTFPTQFLNWASEELVKEGAFTFKYEAKGGIQKPVAYMTAKDITAYALLQVLTAVATHRVQSNAKRAEIDKAIGRLMFE